MITNSPAACGGICGGARCSSSGGFSACHAAPVQVAAIPCIQRAKHRSNTILPGWQSRRARRAAPARAGSAWTAAGRAGRAADGGGHGPVRSVLGDSIPSTRPDKTPSQHAQTLVDHRTHLCLNLVLEHRTEHGLKAGGGPGGHAVPGAGKGEGEGGQGVGASCNLELSDAPGRQSAQAAVAGCFCSQPAPLAHNCLGAPQWGCG